MARHTRVPPAIRSLVEDVFGATPVVVGRRYMKDGRRVEIIAGEYWGEHGLSNFWTWREVLADGSLSVIEESGYGEGFTAVVREAGASEDR